jgi:DNA-binding IclR family transcriptional regulator
MHAVSSGQVLLAFRPAAALERYLQQPLERFTEVTLTDPGALRERLREVRHDGYAWAREEFDRGINSVAAPVADASGEVVAAVHLHGPSYRFPGSDNERVASQAVVAAAARVAASLRESG